ncbi:hybrid NRPS/PKS enzyme [Pochonia chlamydosporia 170]|uniref:Hybrid NRPS/PKS enzyme n=1 Tax=Pochonia chlamydosporia 170 TaxID=1380566 RepID=A0A179FHN6_METCM|nr:hybrid NRPS/PKS enzyme [Pochonia chlamydosporia 170]OAQ65042.1 hybrid NRPS/PKS enzyme [Pochonia chlamydosporia 170]
MTIGIGRALAVELPHVNINYLDFDSAVSWDAGFIVRHVLEMTFSSSSEKNSENMLWTLESEVLVKDGQVLVPRVVPDTAANELYNAKRRTIKKLLSSDERVEIVHDGALSRARLVKGDQLHFPAAYAVVNVDMSLAIHVLEESPCFLCFGKLQKSGEAVFALAETASSAVVVPKESVFKLHDVQTSDSQTLAAMASALIVSTIISTMSTHRPILVCGVPRNVQGIISTLAMNMGHRLLFLKVATQVSRDEIPGCIVIHPCAPTRHIRSQIPHDSAVLYALSNDDIETVLPLLPKGCIIQSFDPGFTIRQPASHVGRVLKEAYQACQTLSPELLGSVSLETVHIRDVPDKLHEYRERLSAAVVYDRDLPVSVSLQSFDPRNIFSSMKTYFFVGMTGELGQSLCRYIVQAGARHIVLASRNPTENMEWVSEMRLKGIYLHIVRMDVTLQSQVRETLAMIRRTMPPIGGVANAALVLESGIFVNASAESVERQMKPKVSGLSNLDQEFSNDSLDFFLAFGSLGTVCGTAGQAVYHAGNMFMSSMIEKRRRRGQAASILQLGLLVDVGYVSRTDREQSTDLEGTLRAFSLTPLSESEFHYAVLQAIISGKPGSASGEVIVGIEPYVDRGDKTNRPSWVEKACFSPMVKAPVSVATANPLNVMPQSVQVAREELNKAKDFSEAVATVQKMFCRKISTMVRIPESSIDHNSPVADVGLDSLHGIEMRNWLFKEINIRLPLLRILGREPLSSLCASVAKEFMDIKPVQGDIPEGTDATPAHLDQCIDLEDNVLQCVDAVTKETVSEVTIGLPSSQDEDSRSQTPSTPVDTATPTSDSVASDHVPWGSLPVDKNGDVSCPSLNMDTTGRQADLKAKIIMRRPSTAEAASEYQRTERLSFAQTGIHFLHTLSKRPTSLNVTVQYTIKGSLNIDRLSRAIEMVLGHYQAHQACYLADSGSAETRQYLSKEAKRSRLITLEGTEADARLAFDTISNQEYSLSTGETFRAVLIAHEPERHSLVLGFHLIASDAYSFSIFLKELNRAYQMLPLSPSPGLFLNFACQQRQDLEYGKFSESITYWKSQLLPLAAPMPLLPLSKAKTRQARQFYGNNKASRELNSSIVENISKVSQLHGATCMQFYLAVLQVLLMRLVEIDDMCIGVTDSGRDPTGDFVNSIGHFANVLPMRFMTDLSQTFESLLNATSQIVLSSFEHSQIPFDVLLEKFGIERSPLSTPVFQVAFNYRLGDIMQQSLGDCIMTMERYDDVKTAYDLTINVTKTPEQGHLLECITADNLYSPTATEFILDTFVSLIKDLSQDQSVRIQDCPLFSDDQIQHGTSLGRGPSRIFSWPRTLSERFMQVAADFPNVVAIKDQNISLAYSQLSDQVAEYAARLLDANVEFGSRIIVLCEPSVDLYTILLAILHIGAVYVPLDANLPLTRQIAIVEACCPDLLIYHEATSNSAVSLKGIPGLKSISFSDLQACPVEYQQLCPAATLTGDEDGFILFTSGTTSTPKGILLSQSGIMNYAASKSELLCLDQVTVLQQTSISFDMAIAQAFNAFANGGTLVIAPSNVRGDPIELAKVMLAGNIQFTLCTPSEYLMLTTFAADILKQCSSWKYACSGGEVVTERLVNAIQDLELPDLTFTDCYGPTEISCATTFRQVELSSPVVDTVSDAPIAQEEAGRSVGMPIPNTHIYILSERDSSPLPQGMPGEICVAGSGVAKGYLLEELNQQKFVLNPFATLDDKTQEWHVMYRTGDRGLLQPDGSLTFLGRTDGGSAVIKLRGMRIDLGEVANAIIKAASQHGVVDAVVVSRGEPQYLICYVVLATGVFMKQQRLQSFLQDIELPRYMIPSAVFALERFPITSNGKIDRAALEALPVPDEPHSSEESDSTLTVPEIELQNIWRDVLGEAAKTAEIGADTDFFTVGGSSLLLVHLQSALTDRTGVTLSLQQLYQATTLRPMSALMHADRVRLTEDKIDWVEETSMPANFQDIAPCSSTVALRKHKRHVLLTGSTSFLGQEILRQLITNNDVEKVHCIAVPDAERHNVPMQEHSKVVIYSGSLQSPTLGLSSKQREFLQSNVDQIIHAAVQGHCMNNYKSVRQALYLSTQSLVRLLALPRRIPFHFVSAPRVVLLSGKVEGQPVSMSRYHPPTDGSQGVTAANWASEQFLEHASRDLGLPVVINRHCALVGERAPADDVMNSVIRFSLLTGRVPHISAATGFFDFEDVSVVAAELANQPLASPGQVCFRHQSSNVRVPFNKLACRLQQVHNREFEVVDASEWLDCAVTAGMEHLLFIHLRATMASGSPIIFPYLGE